jgi:peptidoglycan/LPS O-acetylase OafA/YrhL
MSVGPRTAEGLGPLRLEYRPQLDALRAVAVAAVVVQHGLPVLGKDVPLAHAGVRLFFVLSGYLITTLLLQYRDRAAGGGRWQPLGEFYLRRCLRIWPLYFFVVALALALDVGPVRQILPWLLTHTVNFCLVSRGEWVEGFFHFWTLSVEEQFYLVWPLFVLFAPRRWLLAGTLSLIAVGPLYRGWAVAHGWSTLSTYCPTPACFDTIGAGALLALLSRSPGPRGAALRALQSAVLPAGVVAFCLLVALQAYGIRWPKEVLLDAALALIFGWLVSRARRGFGGLAGRAFEFRPVVYLGKISYGVYVYHVLLPALILALSGSVFAGLDVGEEGFGALQNAVLLVALVVVPVLSWHFLERPVNDLKDSLGRGAVAGAPIVWLRKRGYVALTTCAVVLLPILVYGALESWQGYANRESYARRARDGGAAAGTAYYVSLSGNDDAPGTSPALAWRTLDRVNRQSFQRGDSILLEGGREFAGCLRLDADDEGTPDRPIVLGAYGDGPAIVNAGDGCGLRIRNTMGIQVRDLIVVGSGPDTNRESGVVFENNLAGDVKLAGIHIDRVEVKGFGRYGVLVVGKRKKSGFREVRITNVVAHRNALAGIYVTGQHSRYIDGYSHEDVYIGYSRSHDNDGVAGPARPNSGSGIVLSDVDGGTIERCVVCENGRACDSQSGGPVGVWAWDANNVVIQHNESYRNHTGGPYDGGGFDLDGGVTNSVLQYNYSHDNDGAGYLLCQFSGARRFGGNTVRYNISQNDGRKNRYGGIHVHDENYARQVHDCHVYNNTVYNSPSPGASPSAMFVQLSAASDVCVRNNIFQAVGGAGLVTVCAGQHNLRFQGNNYCADGAAFRLLWEEASYPSLAAWRQAASQERVGDRDVGSSVYPGLRGPGRAGTLGDPALLPALDAYRLGDDSPLIGAGLGLTTLFGIDPGPTDFFGTRLPRSGAFEVGAYQLDREPAAKVVPFGRDAGLPARGPVGVSERRLFEHPLPLGPAAAPTRAQSGHSGRDTHE